MIISRGRQYIFVHVPKTGGTSLALALENRAMKDDILLGDTPKAKRRRHRVKGATARGRLWKHSKLADIEGLVTAEEIAAFRVFTLVRNPWDRMVSYYHWLQAQTFDHPAVTLAKSVDFSGFLNAPETVESFRTGNAVDYVRDPSGTQKCELFLRLEHLEDDLPKLEDMLGLKLAPLAHLNKSARPEGVGTLYSAADRQLIAELAAPDIEAFGYTFPTSCK